MSDLNKDLEGLVGDMGMSVSNEAPTNLETTAEQPQEAPVDSAPQEVQEPVQQEAQQSLRTTQVPTPSIPLPDVSGTQMPTLSPLSEDRLALDEQLFGRPSRLG